LFSEKIVTQDGSLISKVLAEKPFMDKIFDNFSVLDGQRVKEIERTTNHDVKAIEYFLKE
jgi:adenylosuccinate lyase